MFVDLYFDEQFVVVIRYHVPMRIAPVPTHAMSGVGVERGAGRDIHALAGVAFRQVAPECERIMAL